MNTEKSTVGIMSSLPIFGQMNPMMMRMGGGGRQHSWVVVDELKRDFNVKEIHDIIAAFERAEQQGRQTALATVVHVDGSSYRRPGARMLVTDEGQLTGFDRSWPHPQR